MQAPGGQSKGPRPWGPGGSRARWAGPASARCPGAASLLRHVLQPVQVVCDLPVGKVVQQQLGQLREAALPGGQEQGVSSCGGLNPQDVRVKSQVKSCLTSQRPLVSGGNS